MKIDVSIIYVYYNTPSELKDSVRSIRKAAGNLTYEIIVVDNDSPKKIPQEIVGNKKVKIVRNRNTGYGSGLNIGVRNSSGKNLILANPDVVFEDQAIKYLVQKLKDKKTGVVGPQMKNKDGEIIPTISGEPSIKALIFSTSILNKLFPNTKISRNFWLPGKNRNKEQKVAVVGGACMAVRREVFEVVGGFDERFFMYFEENDFCIKVRKEGYLVIYYPEAKVMHRIGASSSDKEGIEYKYRKSRFEFLKKYNPFYKALLAEYFFRLTTFSGALLFASVIISVILNLYRIDSHMLFIGDFGRDYLAARDMLLTGRIPLVGIPSSVVWLHQGPLSIYFIAFSLWLGNFNPIAPAVFYAVLGIFTVFLVYFFSKIWFGRRVAALSALFYATSPLVIVSARMPYHTSSIPFFTLTFFILLSYIIKGKKNMVPVAAFNLGLLLQLELSNAVLLVIEAVLYFFIRPKVSIRKAIYAIGGFLAGILPFILYDVTHNFIQTVGFPLWVINRVRLFLGLAQPEKVTTGNLPEAIHRIYQQFAGIVFPENQIVALFLAALVIWFFVSQRKLLLQWKRVVGVHLLVLWIGVPVLGFMVHAAPGTAYFPLLFPAVVISISCGVYSLYLKNKIALIIILVICFFNSYFLLINEYYLSSKSGGRSFPPFDYGYGMAFELQKEAVIAIVADAQGREFSLSGGGFITTFATGLDNYTYLLWYYGGKMTKDANLRYILFENPKEMSKETFFNNGFLSVVRDEIY